MNLKPLIIIGAGGHAKACIDVIEKSNLYAIKGFIDNKKTIKKIFNYPYLGTDSDLNILRNKFNYAFVAIGQVKNSLPRINSFNLLTSLDYTIPKIISPLAHVAAISKIEEGSIVMHHAIINSESRIGKNCIINSKSLIEHDSKIGNYCHISTGVIINGECHIGDRTFIGSGSITKQCISIGNNCLIGAGVILKRNIKTKQVINN